MTLAVRARAGRSAADHADRGRRSITSAAAAHSYEDMVDLLTDHGCARQSKRARPEPGSRVALWAPKRLETYVSLYAALASGAAYVPIETSRLRRRGPPGSSRTAGAEILGLPRLRRHHSSPAPCPPSLRLMALLDGDSVRRRRRRPARSRSSPGMSWPERAAERRGAPAKTGLGERPRLHPLHLGLRPALPRVPPSAMAPPRAFVNWAGDLVRPHPGGPDIATKPLSPSICRSSTFSPPPKPAPPCWRCPQWPGNRDIHLPVSLPRNKRITVWYSVPTILDRIGDESESRGLLTSAPFAWWSSLARSSRSRGLATSGPFSLSLVSELVRTDRDQRLHLL